MHSKLLRNNPAEGERLTPYQHLKTSFFETIQQGPSVIILDDKINVFTHVYITHLPLLEICPLG